jgi:hypothetical protein
MNDDAAHGLTPAEEDPELHRMLGTLPTPEPTGGLEERVLSRVWRPASPSVRRLRAVTRGLVESGRIWLVAGGLAFGSLIPLAAVFVVSRIFAHEISGAVRTFVARATPWTVAAVSGELASLLEAARAYVDSLGFSGSEWAALGGGSAVLLVGCVLGLRRTMTPSRSRR